MVKSHTFKVRIGFHTDSGQAYKKGDIFVAKSIPVVRSGFELFNLEFENGEKKLVPCDCVRFYEEGATK